jgi:hypothetical protein
MDRNTLYTKRKDAIDQILAKMPGDAGGPNDKRKAEIRALLDHGDGFHKEVGQLMLIQVLEDFPS